MKNEKPDLTLEQREKLLEKVCRLIARKYYDPTFNGRDWPSLVSSRKQQILNAKSADEFAKEVHSLVSQLGVSHVGFLHKTISRVPARRSISATLYKSEIEGGSRWIFQDVHLDGPAYNAGIRSGDVMLKLNGREIHPPEDPEFPMGVTTSVTVQREGGRQVLIQVVVPASKSKKFPSCQPRLVSCAKLDNSVGCLKVTMFPGQVGIDISKEIDKAVSELGECDRLIVDLRGNTGGGLGMLRVMSYLTPHKVPIGYSLTRRRAERSDKAGVCGDQLGNVELACVQPIQIAAPSTPHCYGCSCGYLPAKRR